MSQPNIEAGVPLLVIIWTNFSSSAPFAKMQPGQRTNFLIGVIPLSGKSILSKLASITIGLK